MVRGYYCRIVVVGSLLFVGGMGAAPAQFPDFADPGNWAAAQFIPQNRQLQNLLERAREQLAKPEEDQRRGLELVQQIIDEAEDFFSDATLGGSVRGTAEELLANLPEAGRRLYEQTYGAEARALLMDAARPRRQVMAEVIRRYFFTKSGGQAAAELAAIEMDRGEFLKAARLYDRLWTDPQRLPNDAAVWRRAVLAYWKSGHPRQSQELLLQAQAASPAELSWDGRPVPQFANGQAALAWLNAQLGHSGADADFAVDDWLLPGGAADRNASVGPASPVFDDAWRTPLLGADDARTQQGLDELRIAVSRVDAFASRHATGPVYEVAEPLVIGDTVLLSSYGRIKAVDARTGRFRWQSADADPVFVYLAQNLASGQGLDPSSESTRIDDFLAQRAWLDATSASLSSDGQRVYEVFDSGMIGPFREQLSSAASTTDPLTPQSYNRLRAYEIATEGKLLWEVGGPSGRVSLPLADTFFLGPPLPLDDSLFVLGEERGQVRLIVMEAQSGDVQWSLPLLNVSDDINNDLERRIAGLSPAQAGDLLICPTGGGMLVAVDRLRRSLAWGHVYNEPQREVPAGNIPRGFRQLDQSRVDSTSTEELLAGRRWHGVSTKVAGPFVIHAPCDHAELTCVRLLDGRPVWTRPRMRMLYPAGIHQSTVILVGERNVEAVELASGNSLWSLPLGMPSGRGVRDGRFYHLPLRGGEVATIDLESGRLLARSPTRSGSDLGSLVAAAGRFLTQTTSEVRGFRSLDELHRQIADDLAAKPDDAAALAVRGELQLHGGQTDAALADLRTSFAAAEDERVQALIVDTLLERLGHDFSAHRQAIAELERLTSDPQQRIRLMRTIAEGLEAEGEWLDAYARYLDLLSLEGLDRLDEHVSEQRTVRLDRWVQGRVQQIYERAAPELRVRIDAKVSLAVDEIIEGGNLQLIERAALVFRDHPAGARACEQLTDLIDPRQRPLRAEALWLKRRRDGTAEQRADAVARLAELYADNDRGALVELLLAELDQEYADVVVQEGKTGRARAIELREQPEFTAALSKVVDWPTTSMEVSKRQEGGGRRQTLMPLPLIGQCDPLFAGASMHLNSRGEVTAYDSGGHPEWSVRLQFASGYGFPETHFVDRRGHLALLFLGDRFHVVDMLRRGVDPHTIVTDDIVENPRESAFGQRSVRVQLEGWGLRGPLRRDNLTGEFFGNTGPLTTEMFCYQKGGTLHALDPLSGDELWHLDETPLGCEIFADDSYVILVPPDPRPDHRIAHILQAADGEFVATRKLPSDLERQRRQADWGRLFLAKRREANGITLAMFDPVSGKNVWERPFPQFQAWAPRDGHDLVVLEKDGLLSVLDAQTGRTLLDRQADLDDDVQSMSVTSHPQEWYLFTERKLDGRQQSGFNLPTRNRDYSVAAGPALAFERRTGRLLWNREIRGLIVDPSLPSRWPLLVLSSEAKVVPGGRRNAPPVKFQNLLLLNKRTGDVVFEGDGDGRWQGTTWDIQEDMPQLLLSFSGTVLAVSFAETAESSPLQPPSPAETEPNPVKRRIPASPTGSPPDGEEN